jgi:hypothetical protein
MSLEELKSERETQAQKFEYATFRLENSEKRAQDATSNLWKADSDIGVVKRELTKLRCSKDTIVE